MGTPGRRSPRRRYPRAAAPAAWPSPGAGRHPAAPRRGVSENKLLPAHPRRSILPSRFLGRSLALLPVAPAQRPGCWQLGPQARPCPAAPRREARREGRGRPRPWRADGGRVPSGQRRARGPRGDGGALSRRGKLKLLTAASAELRGAGGAGRRGDRRRPRVPPAGSARLRRRFSARPAAAPRRGAVMGRGGIVEGLRLPSGCSSVPRAVTARPGSSRGKETAGWVAARNLAPLERCAWHTGTEALLGG